MRFADRSCGRPLLAGNRILGGQVAVDAEELVDAMAARVAREDRFEAAARDRPARRRVAEQRTQEPAHFRAVVCDEVIATAAEQSLGIAPRRTPERDRARERFERPDGWNSR